MEMARKTHGSGQDSSSGGRQRSFRLGALLSAIALLVSTVATLGVLAVSTGGAGAVTTPQTSAGTDFWVTFESNCTFDGCGTPSGPGDLYLFISGGTATTGTVTVPGISFSQAFSVTPGTATEIQLPSTAEDDVSDSVEPDGVHITAGAPVSAYGLNTLEYTTDGYLGLPTDILGTSYIVEGYGGGTGSQVSRSWEPPTQPRSRSRRARMSTERIPPARPTRRR